MSKGALCRWWQLYCDRGGHFATWPSIPHGNTAEDVGIAHTRMQCCSAVQMLVPVISLAFLIVIASTAIYTPLLLYVFDLRRVGWLWEHGALFSAMISSTDAVAVSAILKKGGAC